MAQKKTGYKNLRFCQSDDAEVKAAIAQYASEAKPEDVIAIDNRTRKIFGIGKAKGILFTKNAIYSSFLEDNNPIYYKDIKHAALSVEDKIRFKMKNGESIECDFGQANDLILEFLLEIIT